MLLVKVVLNKDSALPFVPLFVDPVESPTNFSIQTLTGSKDANTSIWINSVLAVPADSQTSWSYQVALEEGINNFAIESRDAAGNSSGPSAIFIEYDETAPLPVNTLAVNGAGHGTTVFLDWTGYDEDIQGDIDSYNIYVEPELFTQVAELSPVDTVPAGTFSYQAINLTKGSLYYFAVIAVDNKGNSLSSATPVSTTPADTIPPENISGLPREISRSRNVFRILHGGGRTAGRGRSAPGGAMRLFERLFVRPGEKAAFEFTAINLGRDRGFRLKAYPILGVPILMLLMSLPDRGDPLFFVLMLHLMNLYLPLVLSFLPFGDHHRAAWIFEALPAAKPRIFLQGAEKAFIFRTALPLFLLNATALAVIWTPTAGVLNAFYAFLAGLFPVGAQIGRMKDHPFSRPFRGVVVQDFGGALSGSLVLLGLAAWIQYASRDSLPALCAGIALMLLCHKARFALRARRAAAAGSGHR